MTGIRQKVITRSLGAAFLVLILFKVPCTGELRMEAASGRMATAGASKLAKFLNLNRDQEKKMADLMAGYQARRIQKTSTIRDIWLAYLGQFSQPEPDLDRMDARLKEIKTLEADIRFDEIRILRDARKILNDAQFQKYKKLAIDRFLHANLL